MSKLHVESRGTGAEVVLLHGWGLNVRVWDGLVQQLSDGFAVTTIDLPGHGRSAWSEDAATLEGQVRFVRAALAGRPAPFALLGWSFGGQIALQLAASDPGLVERLVLVATTPRFEAGPGWQPGMAPTLLRLFANQLSTDYHTTVTEFLELQVRGSANSSAVLRQLREAIFAHGQAEPAALAAGLDVLASTDLRAKLPMITAPALVIAGQYDRVTPPQASRTLSESLHRARYLELRRAAHAPFLSHPDEFAAAVRAHLQETLP